MTKNELLTIGGLVCFCTVIACAFAVFAMQVI
jgi:hypothetical protein